MLLFALVLDANAADTDSADTSRIAGVVTDGANAPVYSILGGRGSAQLLLHAANGVPEAALSELVLAPGAEVATHTHADSVEILYIMSGSVTMTIDGKERLANAGDAIYIPRGTPHAARVAGTLTPLRVVQVYVGPGPEQRFTSGAQIPRE